MSRLVTFQIFILILSALSTLQHECAHDKVESDIKVNGPSYSMYSSVGEGRFLLSYDYINLLIDTTTLTGVPSSFSDYVVNSIMPAVQNYVQATIKVPQRTANLKAGGFSTLCNGDITVPSIYNTQGVDADLVLFVRAVNDPSAPYVASASACLLDTTTQRPLIGRMTYNLAKMAATTNDAQREQHLVTTLHEFTHVLGFSNGLYNYYINPDTGKSLTGHVYSKMIMGLQTTILNLPPLTDRIKKYYNCSTIEGAYLENQGGAGSAGSHFERRVFYNEYMTASSLIDSRISQFTLALLEGTGWYQVNYDMAESMTWGKNKGCSFLTGACVNTATGKANFEEFCSPLLASTCSWTNRAGSSCGAFSLQVQPDLPSAINWWKDNTVSQDSFSDNCPIRLPYGNMDCEDPDNAGGATIQGETYGYGSKCFMATLYPRGKLKTAYPYCFKSSCKKNSSGKFFVELIIGSKNVTCTSQAAITVPGYSGVVNCPDPESFCQKQTSEGFCRRGCTGKGSCVDQTCVCEPGWTGFDCSKRASTTFSSSIDKKVGGISEVELSKEDFRSTNTESKPTVIQQTTSSKNIVVPIVASILGVVALVGGVFLIRCIRRSIAERVSKYRIPPKLTVNTQKVPDEVSVSSNQNSPELSKRPFNFSSSHQDSPILPPNSKARARLYSPSIFKNITTPVRVREEAEGEKFGIKIQPLSGLNKAVDLESPNVVVGAKSFLERLEQPEIEQFSPQKNIKDEIPC